MRVPHSVSCLRSHLARAVLLGPLLLGSVACPGEGMPTPSDGSSDGSATAESSGVTGAQTDGVDDPDDTSDAGT